MLKSALCTYAQYSSSDFVQWRKRRVHKASRPHRKDWELAFIAQALQERGLLTAASSGLGFGVGTEILPCLFASLGCDVLATDGPPHPEWTTSDQHAGGVPSKLEGWEDLDELARQKITLGTVDMRAIPDDLHRRFNFIWSTSSLEHIGNFTDGTTCIRESLKCLKPGGVAVHVTEFSVFPVEGRDKLDPADAVVIYPKELISALIVEIRSAGYRIEANWNLGNQPEDYYVDQPPYEGPVHMKLFLAGFVITSLALIIEAP